MNDLTLHLSRLHRHYEIAVNTYDEISLLDLSHSLRMWADLKIELKKLAPQFGTTLAFKSATPSKKIFRVIREKQYILLFMPGGVVTYASNGNMISLPDELNAKQPISSTHFKVIDRGYEFNTFQYLDEKLDNEELHKHSHAHEIKRCNFAEWMGAEAVRLRFAHKGVLKAHSISREIVIRRVANTLNGSHPRLDKPDESMQSQFDPSIKHLMRFTIGGLPLPYFILLKIAQDIVDHVPKILGIERINTRRGLH